MNLETHFVFDADVKNLNTHLERAHTTNLEKHKHINNEHKFFIVEIAENKLVIFIKPPRSDKNKKWTHLIRTTH